MICEGTVGSLNFCTSKYETHSSPPLRLLISYILNLQIKAQFVKIKFIHNFSLVFNSKNLRNSLK
jgi:hypothetical protein